jgi:folate-dependent phosphoribosylglycinamide formyltransferase PurN
MITGLDATGTYLALALRRSTPVHVIRVVWRRPPERRSWPRAAAIRPKRVLELIEAEWRERAVDRLGRHVSRELFGTPLPPAIHEDECIHARQINAEPFATRLQRLAPDVLLVNSAPILAPTIWSVPRLFTLNVHYGIAPRYRGTATLFWALYRRDYDYVGATLHHVTSDLDGGPIVGHAWPRLERGDDESQIFAATARSATDLVVEYLERVRAGRAPAAVSQRGGERPYRRADRRMRHDLWFELTRPWSPLPVRRERRVWRAESVLELGQPWPESDDERSG